MEKKSFERLKRNVGGLLSFNNFLSTSSIETVAKSFVSGIVENHTSLVALIFEIDVDTTMNTSSPFAFIGSVSQMTEEETLFSILTVFRIGDIKQSEDGIWHVQLKMTMDDDEQLRQLAEYVRHEFLLNPPSNLELEQLMTEIPQDYDFLKNFQNLLKFISIMTRIGQGDDAHRLLLSTYIDYFGKDSIDQNNPLYSFENIMNSVERITCEKKNTENSLEWVENILTNAPPSDKYKLADLYGAAASKTKEPDRALEYHRRHLQLLQETGSVTDIKFIQHYLEVGEIFFEQDSFENALTNYELALQKALELQQPINPLLGQCYHKIGFFYQKLGEFEKALEYHQQALAISRRALPPTHEQLFTIHGLSAACLLALNRREEAMEHFEKATTISQTYTGHEPLTEAMQRFAELSCRPRTNPSDSSDWNEVIARFEKMSK